MNSENFSYQQIFHSFGIHPVYESSFCCLLKEDKRHFCVYHEKESGKIRCLYMNTFENVHQRDLLSLVSPYQDLQYISLDESNNEYAFQEPVTSDFIIKWCYSIRKTNLNENIPEAAREIITHFEKNEDIYIDENNQIKMILRDKNGTMTDLLQYRGDDFEVGFSNQFGSWDDRPETSSLLHNLYTTNPYLIPPFFEENNPYHYHTHVVSGYHFPEFTHKFMQIASDIDSSLEPSFFLLNSLKDYIGFIDFLCHYATIKSKKNFFRHYLYTDHIAVEIIPFDSPLGHTGLNYKSWQTAFSQKLGENIRFIKWQTGSGIYTGVPLKIDVLHQLCLGFIHLNKFSIRIINRILDVDAIDDQDQLTDLYDEQIF